MQRERKYTKDYIECTFCGKSCNLNSCNKHLNSKSCKQFQENDEKKTEKYFAFRKLINQLREKIKEETTI
jgi:hypothetical protein